MSELHIEQVGELFVTIEGFYFLSKQNLLEFDFIVIDLHELIKEVNDSWPGDVEPRFTQLKEFAKRKDIPIVFFCTRNHSRFFLDAGTMQTSLFKYLDIEVDEIETEGRKIEISPNTQFANFVSRYSTEFEYLVGFISHPGISIGNAKSKNASVGFYTKDYVFLPSLTEGTNMDEEDFLNDLYQICRSIRKGDEIAIVPDWADKFLLPGEAHERDTLNQIESDIEQLIQKREESKNRLATFLPLKQLWTGTGFTLERSARLVFEELGFTILPAEPNRDDIIMSRNEQIVIVEVKGLTKSAGEKNAGQLEKWLGTYLSDKGIIAKGILLVNAFREFPLDERTQAAFPDQMIPYATRRDQCLLTTVQLCSLLLHCRAYPDEKDAIIEELLTTVGLYNKFSNWGNFITCTKKVKSVKKASKKKLAE
ncbi:hypothetical protein [Chitinophaga filiformis]|uniref:Uncharacterized protein n=1 Tax=Chitinophaga filiformis TaxID=104663 RepID=A0A1G7MEX4_CHIFI|nr:hypothetical protein [Chitinophaga filiformis]SDF60144.1 hypothetical protein SAMN04488121_102394 [Chitinophaga filiformis]